MICDIRQDPEKPCALCGDETACLELELKSAFHKKVLSILVGPSCRLGMEAGLRAQRKWEIRGGAELGRKAGGKKKR